MNAIQEIFPEVAHLLCRRHISKCVHKFIKDLIGNNSDFERKVQRRWSRIVKAKTPELYEQAVAEMTEAWAVQPRFMDYCKTQWLDPYHDRFVHAWTKDILHYGAHTTNR